MRSYISGTKVVLGRFDFFAQLILAGTEVRNFI